MKKLISIILGIVLLTALMGCTPSKGSSENFSEAAVSGEREDEINQEGSSSVSIISSTETIQEETSLNSHDYEFAKSQIDKLTTHLISACNLSAADKGNKQSFEPDEINNFMFLTYRYIEDTQYIYHDLISSDLSYLFSVDDVNRTVYELFGIDDWKLEGGDVVLNVEKQQYETSLAFGVGGNLSCENISSEIFMDNNTIQSTFLLTDNKGFKGESGWNEYGDYSITFQIMKEDDHVFLRFVKMSGM